MWQGRARSRAEVDRGEPGRGADVKSHRRMRAPGVDEFVHSPVCVGARTRDVGVARQRCSVCGATCFICSRSVAAVLSACAAVASTRAPSRASSSLTPAPDGACAAHRHIPSLLAAPTCAAGVLASHRAHANKTTRHGRRGSVGNACERMSSVAARVLSNCERIGVSSAATVCRTSTIAACVSSDSTACCELTCIPCHHMPRVGKIAPWPPKHTPRSRRRRRPQTQTQAHAFVGTRAHSNATAAARHATAP